MALQYLKRLSSTGYFEVMHVNNEGTWFPDLPACRNSDTNWWVGEWLREQGYVRIVHLSDEQIKALRVHPRETNETWWFELTEKGAEACG